MEIDKKDALGGLSDLISHMHRTHIAFSEKWRVFAEHNGISMFNQRTTKVISARYEERYRMAMSGYLSFLNDNEGTIIPENLEFPFDVNHRIKAANSIEEKFEDYCEYRGERGEVSFNKCFNDLFGARAIVGCNSISFEDISAISSKYRGTDTISRIVDEDTPTPYKATHIYFKHDNTTFRWELQIWLSEDEATNQESHKTHRYKYRNMEREVQRG